MKVECVIQFHHVSNVRIILHLTMRVIYQISVISLVKGVLYSNWFVFLFTEKIVATEAGNQAVLREGLMAICRPMLRSLFVCESGIILDYYNKKWIHYYLIPYIALHYTVGWVENYILWLNLLLKFFWYSKSLHFTN